MIQYVNSTVQQIQSLSSTPLLRGWVSVLQSEIKSFFENSYEFKVIALIVHVRRVSAHNLYVSVRRSTNAIKNEIIQSLVNFFGNRFDKEEVAMITALEKFSNFEISTNLTKVHKCIATDLDLGALSIEFHEIINVGIAEKIKNQSVVEKT